MDDLYEAVCQCGEEQSIIWPTLYILQLWEQARISTKAAGRVSIAICLISELWFLSGNSDFDIDIRFRWPLGHCEGLGITYTTPKYVQTPSLPTPLACPCSQHNILRLPWTVITAGSPGEWGKTLEGILFVTKNVKPPQPLLLMPSSRTCPTTITRRRHMLTGLPSDKGWSMVCKWMLENGWVLVTW